jgi:hypothetical protein
MDLKQRQTSRSSMIKYLLGFLGWMTTTICTCSEDRASRRTSRSSLISLKVKTDSGVVEASINASTTAEVRYLPRLGLAAALVDGRTAITAVEADPEMVEGHGIRAGLEAFLEPVDPEVEEADRQEVDLQRGGSRRAVALQGRAAEGGFRRRLGHPVARYDSVSGFGCCISGAA